MKSFLSIVMLFSIAFSNTYAKDPVPQAVTKALTSLIGGASPDSINVSSVNGFYEAIYNAEIFYVSSDGKFLIQGDVYDVSSKSNLTENVREKIRLDLLDSVPEENKITYKAKDKKHSITVFTDIDCPYCAKFHKDVPELNANGVEVTYLAYPRAGVGSRSFKKYVSVYCADDRKKALTDAKAGIMIASKDCKNPVKEQFNLGRRLGVTGTPTLILEDGSKIPGYLPAKKLIRALNEVN